MTGSIGADAVVRGRTAGCVVAARLAASGAQVVLIEAGPDAPFDCRVVPWVEPHPEHVPGEELMYG